jgi:hypothetical protein
MSLEASKFTTARIANMEFGGTAYTPAANLYIRLFSDLVTLDGVGTEITTDGYAPKQVANSLTNFPTTTNGVKQNALQIEMEPLEADSPEIVSVGIFDAASGGNLLYRKDYSSNPFVISGTYFLVLAPGDLSLSFS